MPDHRREPDQTSLDLSGITAEIVQAYVARNALPAEALPDLIASVHAALSSLGRPAAAETERPAPPVPIRKTITADYLISLEDGRPYRTLRRHLSSRGLTPEAYRARWGLPLDYPMTAENYRERRSELARSLGLGRSRKPKA